MSTAFVNELILDEHISENIKKTVATLLHLFDHRNSSSYSHNDSVAFDTAEYIFQRLGSQISILTRDGREVMLNGQLTSFATDKDIRYLQLLSQLVDQYLSIAESGQPTEVTMLMVCIPSSIETLLEMPIKKRQGAGGGEQGEKTQTSGAS